MAAWKKVKDEIDCSGMEIRANRKSQAKLEQMPGVQATGKELRVLQDPSHTRRGFAVIRSKN